MRNAWLGFAMLLTCAAACGGASDSGLFAGGDQSGQSNPNGTSGGTPTPAPNPQPPPGVTPPPAPPGPCTEQTFYEDTDGDGFGGTNVKKACTSPGKGWVTVSGDCDDDDPTVYPGQKGYFSIPYQTNGGNHSFDYDCSKKEEEMPPGYKTASTCALGVALGSCTGDGYLPVDGRPSGTGIDRICGSTRYQTCQFKAGQQTCIAVLSDVPPAECH